jgi:Protein of unknown function (DUF2934)
MREPTEEQVLTRAQEIWDRLGRPNDANDQCWSLAQEELSSENEVEIAATNLGIK